MSRLVQDFSGSFERNSIRRIRRSMLKTFEMFNKTQKLFAKFFVFIAFFFVAVFFFINTAQFICIYLTTV